MGERIHDRRDDSGLRPKGERIIEKAMVAMSVRMRHEEFEPRHVASRRARRKQRIDQRDQRERRSLRRLSAGINEQRPSRAGDEIDKRRFETAPLRLSYHPEAVAEQAHRQHGLAGIAGVPHSRRRLRVQPWRAEERATGEQQGGSTKDAACAHGRTDHNAARDAAPWRAPRRTLSRRDPTRLAQPTLMP